MNLDESQKALVQQWIAEGRKLSEIQSRLAAEFGLNLTYMELRFLMDDLQLKPKDADAPVTTSLSGGPGTLASPTSPKTEPAAPAGNEPLGALGDVTVKIDQITRPGAVVSGKVTFSDGKSADWYLDQMGRLGVVPPDPSYKPSQADLMMFQGELQSELAKLGY